MINGREIRRNYSPKLEAVHRECVLRPVDEHGTRTKIVKGNDAFYRGSERGGNRRIAQVGNVPLAMSLKRVDLRAEGLANLAGCAREIDGHAARALR